MTIRLYKKQSVANGDRPDREIEDRESVTETILSANKRRKVKSERRCFLENYLEEFATVLAGW